MLRPYGALAYAWRQAGTVNGAEDRASLLLPPPQEKGSLSFSSMQAFYDGHLRAL